VPKITAFNKLQFDDDILKSSWLCLWWKGHTVFHTAAQHRLHASKHTFSSKYMYTRQVTSYHSIRNSTKHHLHLDYINI